MSKEAHLLTRLAIGGEAADCSRCKQSIPRSSVRFVLAAEHLVCEACLASWKKRSDAALKIELQSFMNCPGPGHCMHNAKSQALAKCCWCGLVENWKQIQKYGDEGHGEQDIEGYSPVGYLMGEPFFAKEAAGA